MTTARFCPKCQKLVLPGASFCAFCGVKVDASAPAPAEAPRRVAGKPDPAGLVAPCAVLAEKGGVHLAPETGRIVARVTGRPLSDVTRDARNSRGVLATGLTAEQARKLLEELAGARTPAFALGAADFVDAPAFERMRSPVFSASGISCVAYQWDTRREFSAGWDRALLASVGRIEVTQSVEAPPKPKKRGGWESLLPWRGLTDRLVEDPPKLVTTVRYEYVMDIVFREPWERLRLDENTAVAALATVHEDFGKAIEKAARGVRDLGAGVPCNRGVALMASGAPAEAWEELTFGSKQEFDCYVRWLMNLAVYGVEVPG